MTINNTPPYVSFGDFQPYSRSLWILYRQLEDQQEINPPQLAVEERLKEHIVFTSFDLFCECLKWNISYNQYIFLIRQIRDRNQTINPIPFDWDRHAYMNHITNCFILNHEFYS